MTRRDLARLLEHSVLKPETTEAQIREGAQLVRDWRIGFYCVQPWWIAIASPALEGCDARMVAVVGFPHGCDLSKSKADAAARAAADGAAEIDMVMSFGALKSGDARGVAADVQAVVRAVPTLPVKVIIEATALAVEEKRLACRIACDAGASFVKTSTGFHPSGGATVEDVRLLRETVGPRIGVKASGGIRTLSDVEAMLAAGASRIGTSASAAILAAIGPE